MAKSEERRRVLDMLAAGQINVEQATALLKALGPSMAEAMSSAPARREPLDPPAAPPAPAPRGRAPRFLRINISSDDETVGKGNIHVNVPYALAKFAVRFLPNEARTRLDDQGIDIATLLENVNDELPEGKLIDIETDKTDGSGRAHITIEVI